MPTDITPSRKVIVYFYNNVSGDFVYIMFKNMQFNARPIVAQAFTVLTESQAVSDVSPIFSDM